MKLCKQMILSLFLLLVLLPVGAGERTIPVDIHILIDKSLSMSEPGRFDSMHVWVRDHLLGQILIEGDYISVYQFYGEIDHLLATKITGDSDRQAVIDTINTIKPDGAFTDIGLALDTLKKDLDDMEKTDRYKILLLLTDLRQEAPWTSRYAGIETTYESPYLAEARILPHDNWFEITLDMDIQERVVKTSNQLFSAIIETGDAPRTTIESENGLPVGRTDIDQNAVSSEKNAQEQKSPLPLSSTVMIVSLVFFALLAGFFVFNKRKKEKEEEKPKTL